MSSVENVTFVVLHETSSRSSSFESEILPVNQCESISIQVSTLLSSSLSCVVDIYGSINKQEWIKLEGATYTISSDGDFLFTLSELKSLGYVRAFVTINSGSAVYYIIGRTV